MIIVITEREIQLDDPGTFTELAVDAVGRSREKAHAAAVSAGAGVVDGDHLWIDIDFLRGLGPGTEEWNGKFAAMIAYAAGKGWTDTDDRVRAHIRWS
ncbi:hypothetical protein [Rhodococcus jostii]|uniref:Uncharacterized protein n=1 Tax=Rhodococcus jostii TaxID=132919 RepID=A0A1H4QV56_RHOJO|nr:hypothetical protein [Rhodococcus jostii]SEC23371.1 hypothetical protein SAMN04490220_1122 [Rhodococcus jostii]